MFKHISKLFEYRELAELLNDHERLQAGGQDAEATAVQSKIADLLAEPHGTRSA